MPQKKLRAWLPTPDQILQSRTLKLFAPHLADVRLWHFNRHNLNKAVYIGVLCAFFPLPGQMAFALIGALIFRANVPLSLALTWITNPITTLPIFYAAYYVGAQILEVPPIRLRLIAQMLADFSSWIFSDGANPFVTYQHSFSLSAFCLGLIILAIISSLISGLTFKFFWRYKVVATWKNRYGYRPHVTAKSRKHPKR
ncbi:DUF2062 domain-containing protein [Psychrobacter pygoscelis]|uniref:DUF2062 domain-containing protein n=1 Tax=Psychrobacter pygoscelis TaxID=2488563 RepID=UPI00103984DD|nr:DUF2062 domain-containing protein [Psychrobacter pygoscelis]